MFLKPYNLTLSINLYGSCTASYYGKTYRHIMQVQVSEHRVCLLEQVNELRDVIHVSEGPHVEL